MNCTFLDLSPLCTVQVNFFKEPNILGPSWVLHLDPTPKLICKIFYLSTIYLENIYLSYFYLRKILSSKSLSFLYLSSKIFTFPQSISKIFIFLFLYQNIFIFLKYILKTNIFFHFYLGFWGAKMDYTPYLVGHTWSAIFGPVKFVLAHYDLWS